MPKKINEQQLFETVLKFWVERGYAGATTKQIATRAGVNEATLFRRYGGKAELVVAAIRASLRAVPLRDLRATDNVEGVLIRIVEAYLETYRQVGAVFPLLLVEVTRHPELRPAVDVAQENIGFLIRIIEHHQDRGALQKESPFSTLSAFIGPLFVVGLFTKVQGVTVPIDVEAHVRAFLGGRETSSLPEVPAN